MEGDIWAAICESNKRSMLCPKSFDWVGQHLPVVLVRSCFFISLYIDEINNFFVSFKLAIIYSECQEALYLLIDSIL